MLNAASRLATADCLVPVTRLLSRCIVLKWLASQQMDKEPYKIKETKRDTVYVLLRTHGQSTYVVGVYGSRTDAETERDIRIDDDDRGHSPFLRRPEYSISEETVR